MRTGKMYLEGLKDERCVYVDGERVDSISDHPAFRGVVATVANLYDISSDPASGMGVQVEEIGQEANRALVVPRSREDLELRRAAITRWAQATHGLLGRSPDHVGNFMAGFASHSNVFDAEQKDFGENVKRFYARLLKEDLYLSYAIIPPQVDRSKTAQGQEDAFIQVGVVEEKENGIVVRGSQMLGTSAAMADHLFVSCITPMKPGDEDYALSFVLPVGTPGLKLYCRRPYALGKTSVYDYPLSTRFDESDAFVVFEDVFIPWEDVFVYRDVEKVRGQFFQTPAHVLGNSQSQIRLTEN